MFLTMKPFRLSAFLPFCLCALLGSCTWNHPDLVWPADDPEPVEQDTVCTSHTPITTPAFITAYIEMDDYLGDRILIVGTHRDTLEPGDDIQTSLDSMIGLLLPQYTRHVYVLDTDDRLMSVIIDGTNDVNVLLGKMRIEYNGYRHHFGVISQSLIVAGSMTAAEFDEAIKRYPSFRYINWRLTAFDSVTYDIQMTAALDSIHCKGGRDWFQTQFNPYEPLPQLITYAHVAGWDEVPEGIMGTTVELTYARVSDNLVQELLLKGASVLTLSDDPIRY
jgi:hypothetical protein